MDSERVLKSPGQGPGLQGFVILAISRRPRALTRRPPTILKHALTAALFAGVSGFVKLVVMNVKAMTFVAPNLACGARRNIPRSGAATDEQRSYRPNSAQRPGRQVLIAQTSCSLLRACLETTRGAVSGEKAG